MSDDIVTCFLSVLYSERTTCGSIFVMFDSRLSYTTNLHPLLHYFSNVVDFLCSRLRVRSAFVLSLRPSTHKYHARLRTFALDRIAYRTLRAGLPTITPQLQFYWSSLPWHNQPSQ